jgi:hypothetical protein
MDLRFTDHSSFQRAAAGMASGALLFGAALHPVTPLAPLAGGALGIAAGAAIAHGRAVWRVAAVGAALAVLFAGPPGGPVLVAAAALLALAVAISGPRGVRGVAGAAFAALALLVAMWCALRIGYAQATRGWPPVVATAVAAAAMGLVGALATLPRHVAIGIDPVRAALRRLPGSLDAEVRELCARAVAIWSSAKDRVADDTGRALMRDGVVKTLEVAARSASASVVPTGPGDAELAQRLADLEQRIAAATDGEVRAQYQGARTAVADQQRYRERIRQGRERLVARMHNHVAALEKFQLAATGLEAARAASAGAAAVREIDELSHDVTTSGEALAEVC